MKLHSKQSQALELPWAIAGLSEQEPWDLTACRGLTFLGDLGGCMGRWHLCCTHSAAADLSRQSQGCHWLGSAPSEAGAATGSGCA